MGTGPRLYVKITRDTLPRVKDKYPFLYLEHGRLAIDDSSVKWIDSDGNVVRIPIATICSLFLGPGTTVPHEATVQCAGWEKIVFFFMHSVIRRLQIQKISAFK